MPAITQNVIPGYKPYWAVSTRGSMTLYYDATLSQVKDSYKIERLNDLACAGKTKIQFTNPNTTENKKLEYKFDDHRFRNDWYWLLKTISMSRNEGHMVR